jgi:hypothetical protein
MKPGKILIAIVALMTAFGSYVFDWNNTHIFNPAWPPHAKFHNAQTMLLGTMLGFLTLWMLKGNNLRLTVVIASFYWLGQVGAICFPGTALTDPEFIHAGQLPAQLIVDVVMLGMLTLAYLLEVRRFNKR